MSRKHTDSMPADNSMDAEAAQRAGFGATAEDEVVSRIIADMVPDGACLQMGVGALPNLVCAALKHRNDLGIRTEALNPGLVDRPVGQRRVVIKTEPHAPSEVCISVHHSGRGLPDDIDRVFETFYTTKSDGMGMGLSISRSSIQGHGGRLWATRNQPRGAVFHLTLPTDREPDPEMEQKSLTR